MSRSAHPLKPGRRAVLLGLAAAGLTGVPSARAATSTLAPPTGTQISAMTFNIRRLVPENRTTSPDGWDVRRPAVESMLRAAPPTVLGLQEAKLPQLDAVRAALPQHQLVGDLTPNPDRYEYNPIVVDRRRFAVAEWGQHWLSDTPAVPFSTSWGNTVPRFVTWARLTDRATGRPLLVLNTHLDNTSESSRVRSAQTIAGRLRELSDVPVVLTGDFNCAAATAAAHRALVQDGPLDDCWSHTSARKGPDYGTLPAYRNPVVGGDRIDWVLCRGLRTVGATVDVNRPLGVWPSDHAPVRTVLAAD